MLKYFKWAHEASLFCFRIYSSFIANASMYRCLIPYLAGVFSPTSTTRNCRRKIVFRTRPGLEPIPDSSRPTHARRQPSRQSRCQTTRTRPRSWSPSKLQKKLNAMNSTFNFTISENEIWRENRFKELQWIVTVKFGFVFTCVFLRTILHWVSLRLFAILNV